MEYSNGYIKSTQCESKVSVEDSLYPNDSIDNFPLKLVVDGSVQSTITLSSDLWTKSSVPVIFFVARRAGCSICREQALSLATAVSRNEIQNVKLIG